MGSSAKAEQINVKEYIKKVTKAIAETFATLGDILVVTSDTNKLTDADIEAEELWKAHPKAAKAIKALEEREAISEKVDIKTETKKRKPRYEIKEQALKQKPVKRISKDTKTQSKDDDYVK